MQKRSFHIKVKNNIIRAFLFLLLLILILIYCKQSLAFKINNKDNLNLSVAETTTTTTKGFVEKKTFGYAETGRAIEGFDIGNGEDVLLFFGSIHGNEMGTADLLNRLVETVSSNTNLVNSSKRIVVIPILNPDGYYDRVDKLNSNGVNLNLNFATSDWQQYGPDSGDYAGSQPFSEAESRVLKRIVEEYKPNVMISFHSQGYLVNPEYGHQPSIDLAKWYSEKTGYTYFNDESWDYPGTATKWFMETTGNAAITVELTSHSESDWDINKNALIELISTEIF